MSMLNYKKHNIREKIQLYIQNGIPLEGVEKHLSNLFDVTVEDVKKVMVELNLI